MKLRTKLCNPEIYSQFVPNVVDMNNSWTCPIQEKGKLFYRRGFSTSAEILNEIVANVHDVPSANCLIFSSCIGIACVLSAVYNWTRILVVKGTYMEMQAAYGAYNNIELIESDFVDFKKDDLVCFDTVNLTNCKVNDYSDLVKRAQKVGAKICIDNTVPTWYNLDCKEYDPDYLIESLSKFCNGMNNSILGWVYCKDICDKEMLENKFGTYSFAPHPVDCFLTTCGLQTFDFRMEQIKNTSKAIDAKLKEIVIPEIDYTCYVPSGIFMIKIPEYKNRDDLWKLDFKVIRKAVTFGAGFTVIDMGEMAEGRNSIRISVGLEDFQDIFPDIITLINWLYDKTFVFNP